MTDPRPTSDPWGDLFRALGALAPDDVAGHGARSLESLLKAADTALDTLTTVNQVARRLNSLLDELEEPLRTLVPDLARGLATLSTLNDAASALGDLARRFAPVANLFPSPKSSGSEA